MSDIRYICLSDLHLGEEDSLLTNLKTAQSEADPMQASPAMKGLCDCIKELISNNKDKQKKPTLILNGDILELALSKANISIMVFERFIEQILPEKGEKLFDKIIYIPGNHDHHVWELARETQYVENYLVNGDGKKPGTELKDAWHTTNIFKHEPPVASYLLTKLVQRYPHLNDYEIHIAYPNYGLFNNNFDKCIIFHHGHYVESIYHLITNFINMVYPDRTNKPTMVWDIEAENFAWIDFFWSTMGRSGKAGDKIEDIYKSLNYPKKLQRLLNNLSDGLAKQYDIPLIPGDWLEAKTLKMLVNGIASSITKSEKKDVSKVLSDDAEAGLSRYVEKILYDQMYNELKYVYKKSPVVFPDDITFVFGHTHKPFQQEKPYYGYNHWVKVYNTGGWVVETKDPDQNHGASMVLVDDELNTTSIVMYKENEEADKYLVVAKEAQNTKQDSNPFHKYIAYIINQNRNLWDAFSKTAANSVYIRRQHLRKRINS